MRIVASSIVSAVCTAGLAVFSAPAVAATLVPDQGDVRISTDQGFRKMEAAGEVAAATKVLVAPGGRAIISYGESCQVEVRSFAIVQKEPPCGEYDPPAHFGFQEGSAASSNVDHDFTPKVGRRAPRSPKPNDDCLYDPHVLLIIGGAAVGIGLAAVLLSGGGDDAPVSQ